MSVFLGLLSILYVFLIGALFYGWKRIAQFSIKDLPAKTGFSIIIPYRNEAGNLPQLFNSLLKLKYPVSLFEILLVNDASRDASREICTTFKQKNPQLRISLLENFRVTGSPKKDAISTAIQNAAFDYIITTDADCEVPELWLQGFNEKIEKTGAELIAGPVMFSPYVFPAKNLRQEKGMKYFKAFQEMDLLSLQVAGAGGFGIGKAFMCNGANLCYNRGAFLKVGGFLGNGEISSGDDVFLLQKFVQHKLKTDFLKSREAIVLTKPEPDLSALISQRIRWAAKTPAYKSWFAKTTGLAVLLMNFSLIVGCVLAFLEIVDYEPILIAFLFKFVSDLLLLYAAAKFFKRKEVLRHYFWSSLVYPFFSTGVAILSIFKKYEWKGRTFKR
ncbi:glycosyltransferase [Antarcticibacterium arcticum]|uniref:Glycosyltransferase n=1 Tax=Antarcticibacterium arcticum TaxID=2585771 RepID=A0A5B8YPH1_9FLAO|nr:glycosyltransferase [Antarcticibacterium arcticum]QED38797.1 glycosyltransferase [Antarcticibacterium arcticum]